MDGYGRYILAITEDIRPQRGDASGNRYTGDGVKISFYSTIDDDILKLCTLVK